MEDLGATEMMSNTEPIVCEKCGCDRFVQVTLLRKVSRFVIGASEDGVIPIPTFSCQKCGHVNEEFLPKGLSKVEKKEETPKSSIIMP